MSGMKQKLYSLIERFVERQTLVKEAMQQLRPDLIAVHDPKKSDMEIWHLANSCLETPNRGIWKETDSWYYTIHGGGCRLVNTSTSEPLEWDAPEPKEFYYEWFLNWLSWYIYMNEVSPELKALRDITKTEIFNLLLELESEGLLMKNHNTNFRLQ